MIQRQKPFLLFNCLFRLAEEVLFGLNHWTAQQADQMVMALIVGKLITAPPIIKINFMYDV
jgi:hypothetical protein